MVEKFKLSKKFLEDYEGKQPNWGFGALSYFLYKRSYARTKEDGNQEEYWETLKRVVEGCYYIQKRHCVEHRLTWDNRKAQKSAQTMFKKMWEFKFTPPGRGLWLMGVWEVLDKTAAGLYNCLFRSTITIDKEFGEPFAWTCEMLMCGSGVGYDTKGAGKVLVTKPTGTPIVYIIPDSREGWAEAVRLLINSYDGAKGRRPLVFDYSQLRPAGAIIKTFGGTASGPEPLEEGLENIRALLDNRDGELITSVDIVDIFDFMAKFVVAGNTRRSALLALGDPNDLEFNTCKDPSQYGFELSDRRWASNHSIDFSNEIVTDSLIKGIQANGEPAPINLDKIRHYGRLCDPYQKEGDQYYDGLVMGVNPCAEISLEDGEPCNVPETYPANHDSVEEYLDTLKYAFLYAKSVTLLPTHSELTNAVLMRNRRIGVSQTGIQQALNKFGTKTYFRDFCDKGYQELRRLDRMYSRWLGIPTSIKITSVKPSGSVSLLTGSTPGMHWAHSKHYLRTVRVACNSPLFAALEKAGYRIELDLTNLSKLNKIKRELGTDELQLDKLNYSDSTEVVYDWFTDLTELERKGLIRLGATTVVYFPIEESNFTKSKKDVSIWEQLLVCKELQYWWADNSVSNTITLREEDKQDLKSALELFAPHIKTLSFLPLDTHTYLQAPYTTCTEEEYTEYASQLKNLDFTNITEENILGSKYCDNDTCMI